MKEHLVIWESLRALKENNLLSIKNMYGITVRTLFFMARQTMEALGMSEILGALKKKKHNVLWQRSRALAIRQNYSEVKTRPDHIFSSKSDYQNNITSQKKIGLNGLLDWIFYNLWNFLYMSKH